MEIIVRIINFIYHFGFIRLFLIFFIWINLFAFTLYGVDKYRAIHKKLRMSERTLIFFTLVCGGIGATLGAFIFKHKKNKTNFKVALILGMVIAVIPFIHVVHSLTLDTRIRYVEIDFYSANWPASLDGYRIGFMTDMHTITDEEMANVVARLNQKNLDLLLLGGDFSVINYRYQGTLREISHTITTDGIFGVEGNHDHYQQLFTAMRHLGMTPLDNSGVRIREGFYLAGVQDLWIRNPNIAQAIAGAYPEDFILLLTHNPDVSMEQPTSDVDLILAGHTHHGQITIFGYPIYLHRGSITSYGTRFAHGFAASADGVPVFTSSGIGVYYFWPRIFARPEVVIFTMYHQSY